jgi:threonine dehydratase
MTLAEQIAQREQQIRPVVLHTPLCISLQLNIPDHTVYFKREESQHTGSFKLRGATSKLIALKNEGLLENNSIVFTASTGNHGCAVAYASKIFGVKACVYVTDTAEPTKTQHIAKLGGELVTIRSDNPHDSEIHAKQDAKEKNLPFISPYNDWDVIIGQGTLGVEVLQDLPQDMRSSLCVFVSVGGGGLIGGVSAYLKTMAPNCHIIGCQPKNSQVMNLSIQAGHILQDVEELPTLSDGTAGGIDADSITFPLCQKYVDEFVIIDEDEIRNALCFLLDKEHIQVEGSAALCVAAFMKSDVNKRVTRDYKCSVIVLCGRNISLAKLKKVIE